MGLQETTKKLHRHHGIMRVEDDDDDDDQAVGGGKKKAEVWITLPLSPIKVGRRRHGGDGGGATEEELEEEEVTTPTGEGCRIPAEAATCPPAPKRPRTAAVSIIADRRCNPDDGEVTEYFRVPADLESVFASRAAKAN